MLEKIARIILRNRLVMLISLGLITVAMAVLSFHVKLSYETAKILPDDDSTLVAYQKFKQKFGEDGTVMIIGFQSNDLFKLDLFNHWYDLSQEIKNVDGIQEVVSTARSYNVIRNDSLQRLDFKPVLSRRPTSQAEVDSVKSILMQLPFYDGLLFNKESNVTIMAITLDQSEINTKGRIEIVQQIKQIGDKFAADNNLTLHYSGLPYIRTAVTAKVLSEMKLFLILALVITALILLFFFRSFYPVLFPMLVVMMGVIWSFGTLVLLGYKITILSSLIPPLIIVIGVPNCILLLNKYQQEYARHGNQARALSRMISKIGVTTFFANVTTAIGFFVFYFTHSAILQEFGITAAINVMLTYVISLIFIPVVFSFMAPPNPKQIRHLDRKGINLILDKIDIWVHRYRKRFYVIVLLIIAISIYGITKMTTVGYVVDDLPKKDVIYTDLKFFEQNFHGVLPFEVSVDTKKPGGALALPTLYKINRLQKIFASYPEFSEPVSIAEGIKFSYQGLNDGDPKRYIIPNVQELARLKSYSGTAKGNEKMFHSIIDSAKQTTRISIQVADIGSIKMKKLMDEIRPRVDSVFDPKDYNVTVTGNSIIFLKNNDYLQINLKESVMLAILLIGSIMFFLFMSVRMVFIALIPSLVPLIITAGIMGFAHISLKPSTILIFSIAFGIASDGTMYFLTKYRQELKRHAGSISKTVSLTIQETGVSMVYTAVILFFGFFIFTASNFGGTSALGVLISVTLLIAMFSNLIFLPVLLLSLEKRVITRAFLKEPLIQMYDEEEDVELEELQIQKKDDLTE
ncbi:MAG: efflux RND transporter permease subunit [Bacteroidetes bacterium]|nr:efflux RND transporter permease subunit [Bacteroidota bacterium]